MNEKTRKIIGWVLAGVLTAFLGMSAFMKISGDADTLSQLTGFGYTEAEVTLIGIGELVSVLLFLIPRTSSVGLLLLSAYFGGAIASHMQQPAGENDNYIAAVVFLTITWITAIIRTPGVLASFKK